jgi:hypothetical protein
MPDRTTPAQARNGVLASDYDEFYGGPAPVSDTTALGDRIAAEAISEREAARPARRACG